ncbi:MAG TPA: phosphoribosyltransferase family protein, partial [Chitinophagales bacterium]|nr:phosphoribosyltransferase family protein [Chitinophagales bacterium]
ILGIEGGGAKLAQLLTKEIKRILDIPVVLGQIYVNKKAPYTKTPFVKNLNNDDFNRNIVIVDDVASSGSTLFHAIQSVYPLRPSSLHVAVLIDRTHKKFPVKSNIIGMDLATTLTEHIDVVFDDKGTPEGAYIH